MDSNPPAWQPLETLPQEGWVIGKVEMEGRPPAFIGEPYANPWHPKDEQCRWLIDRWSGKWRSITAWMPMPDAMLSHREGSQHD